MPSRRLRLEVDVIVLDVLGEHLLAAHRSASGQALISADRPPI